MEENDIKIILVCKDNVYAEELEKVLGDLGENISVDRFTSARDGFMELNEGVHHAMICDTNTIIEEGAELVEDVRKRLLKTPIVLIKDSETDVILDEALSYGVHGYVDKKMSIKPVARYILNRALEEVHRTNRNRALRESERRLSTLMANLPGMVYRCKDDRYRTMEFVCDGCLELTGYPAAHVVNNRKISYFDIVHPDDRELLKDKVRSALDEDTPFEITYRIFTKDGDERWVWEQGRKVCTYEDIDIVEGFITDITEKRKVEKELQGSEDKYRKIIDNASDGIAIVTGSSVKFVNPSISDMLGYSRDEMIDAPLVIFIAPEELPGIKKKYKEGMEGKEPTLHETVLIKKDGERLHVEINMTVIDYEGDPAAFVFIRDISQRKEVEKTLRESKKFYKTVYDTTLSIAAEEDLAKVLESISDNVKVLLDATDCTVYMLDDDGKNLVPIYSNHPLYRKEIMSYNIPVGEGLSGMVVESRKGDYINYDEKPSRTGIHIPGTDVSEDKRESILSVPLFKEGKVIGAITPGKLNGKFSDMDIHKLSVFARQAELALNKADNLKSIKNSTEALKEKEEMYRTIFESANDSIFIMDKDKFIDCNSRTLDIFECCREDIIGTRPWKFSPEQQPDGRPSKEKAKEKIDAALTGEPQFFYWVHSKTDGTTFDAEVNLNRFLIGEKSFLMAIVRDVTERKEAEVALVEERERLNFIMEATKTSINTLDADYNLRYVDATWKDIYGEPQGRKCYEYYMGRDKPCPDCGAPKAMETKEIVVREHFLPKDERHIEVHTIPYKDKNGEWLVAEFNVDITQRKKAEDELRSYQDHLEELVEKRTEELRKSEDYKRSIVELIPDILIRTDEKGEYLDIMADSNDMLILPKEEVLGKKITEVFPEGEAIRVMEKLKKCIDDDSLQVVEYEIPTVSDKKLWFEARIVPSGNREALALIRDVTERKNAIAALEEKNEELKAFAYSASHDLRAPLRGIEGFSHALMEDYRDALDDDARDYIKRIIEATERMNTLMNDLLNYSKMTTKEMELATVNLEDIVEQVLAGLQKDIENADAEIEVIRPLPDVRSHRSSLIQVISNLVSNSAKYVDPGTKPFIRIYTENTEDKIRICIEDNGIGIEDKDKEKVFNIFERLHGRESYPGTGIGLAIVKKGVERMGGKVDIESEPGKGSRFWIELPTP